MTHSPVNRIALAATLPLWLLVAGCTRTQPEPAADVKPPVTGSEAVAPVDEEIPAVSWVEGVDGSPGPRKPDTFYPGFDAAHDPLPPVRKGGRVIVHLSILPKNLNYMIENSAPTRRMLYETHEFLVERHWETWKHQPVLARSWVIEDTIILKGGRKKGNTNIHFGQVTEDGENYIVTPLSEQGEMKGPLTVPRAAVESVQRGTVFTFKLRDDVKWHDGHPFDANDVKFSYQSYFNPDVDCDKIRYVFEKFETADVLDAHTIRFFYKEQYFLAVDAFTGLMILPSHLYNLADQDNPKHNPKATGQEQAKFLNEHPNNTMLVGLGPYQVTDWNNQFVEAKRFDGYFDPSNAGNVDVIRWRHISSDDAAKQALINGELDFWERLRPEDFYGEYSAQKAFTDRYYKALAPYAYMSYTTWNMRRPHLSDQRVRTALAHAFDWDPYIASVYMGMATRVTGTMYYFSPMYNRSLEPVPYNPERAEELLAEAGWYDRDGDDIIDKDGKPFVLEFLMPTGNKASELFAQKLQQSLTPVGIKVSISTREWATFLERVYERDYDSANMAWVPDLESDPEQLWHSKWATGRSSNHSGVADKKVDELVGKIQVELDESKRQELVHELQARTHEIQPYMFGLTQPKKLAISKRIRNVKFYASDPGYRIREWFLTDDGEQIANGSR